MNGKRMIALLLVMITVISLAACGAKDAPVAEATPEEVRDTVIIAIGDGEVDVDVRLIHKNLQTHEFAGTRFHVGVVGAAHVPGDGLALLCTRSDAGAEQQRQSQENRQELLHGGTSFLLFVHQC